MDNCIIAQNVRVNAILGVVTDWSDDKMQMLQNVQLLRILERRSDNTFQFHATAWNLSDILSLQKMLLSDFPPQIGLKELTFKDGF